MPVERDLDAGMQRGFLEWLGDVAQRSGVFRPRHRVAVGVRRQIDYGNVETFPQDQRCRRAIHFSLDADVHQGEVGRVGFGLRDGVGAARHRRCHVIPQVGEDIAQIFGGDPFILNNQNACRHALFQPHSFWERPTIINARLHV